MKKIPVALQLWSVHEDLRRDFAATCRAVRRIGYRGVELAGFAGLDAAGVRAILDDSGLVAAGMHVPHDRLQSHLDTVIAEARALGTRHVTCASWPARDFFSAASCEAVGKTLDAIGSVLRSAGLRFTYHNHAAEAREVEGHTVFDRLLDATSVENLAAEPDVYWLHVGGCSPEKFIRKHDARVPLIHLKDEKELGSGPVNFPAVLSAIDSAAGVEWLIVEQETFERAPLESVARCFEQLRAWGRI
jgi:sugar phosphate isomerase/epimerase